MEAGRAASGLSSFFFFSSRRRHTRLQGDWSSDVCSSDLGIEAGHPLVGVVQQSVAISIEGDEVILEDNDTEGDLCGHGTACAGVIRSLAQIGRASCRERV